ncbi:MAG TPA: DUF5063 domain-containing protein [Candidatus Paraprevotella stercorigallinarum]|jgi:hypothetical protein|nr:DUF5063 domain-containing protein [Candidatus Paraprevotella stercorigallinarum]
MSKGENEIVYSRNTVEFVTVAAEFCAFLEQSEGRKRRDFVDTMLKLLPLLYLKASLVPHVEGDEEFYPEEFVTEQDYEYLRAMLSAIMAGEDDYMDLNNQDVRFSDEPVVRSVSEDLADIYQALKNFVETYRLGVEYNMAEAVAAVAERFGLYWGQEVADVLKALHRVKYRLSESDDEDEERDTPVEDDEF